MVLQAKQWQIDAKRGVTPSQRLSLPVSNQNLNGNPLAVRFSSDYVELSPSFSRTYVNEEKQRFSPKLLGSNIFHGVQDAFSGTNVPSMVTWGSSLSFYAAFLLEGARALVQGKGMAAHLKKATVESRLNLFQNISALGTAFAVTWGLTNGLVKTFQGKQMTFKPTKSKDDLTQPNPKTNKKPTMLRKMYEHGLETLTENRILTPLYLLASSLSSITQMVDLAFYPNPQIAPVDKNMIQKILSVAMAPVSLLGKGVKKFITEPLLKPYVFEPIAKALPDAVKTGAVNLAHNTRIPMAFLSVLSWVGIVGYGMARGYKAEKAAEARRAQLLEERAQAAMKAKQEAESAKVAYEEPPYEEDYLYSSPTMVSSWLRLLDNTGDESTPMADAKVPEILKTSDTATKKTFIDPLATLTEEAQNLGSTVMQDVQTPLGENTAFNLKKASPLTLLPKQNNNKSASLPLL